MKTKYVAYYRVSTKQQSSNHSLENQKDRIHGFCNDSLIGEFLDIDSGKKANKIGLNDAIKFIKEYSQKDKDCEVILIANELDRLTRSFAINTLLTENNIKFTALDSLNDSQMIIDIKTAVNAEYLRKLSFKTKQGLEKARAKGKQIGSPKNLNDEARAKGKEVIQQKAMKNANNKRALAFLKNINREGKTLQELANILNENGFLTSKGKGFHKTTVNRLLKKVA